MLTVVTNVERHEQSDHRIKQWKFLILKNGQYPILAFVKLTHHLRLQKTSLRCADEEAVSRYCCPGHDFANLVLANNINWLCKNGCPSIGSASCRIQGSFDMLWKMGETKQINPLSTVAKLPWSQDNDKLRCYAKMHSLMGRRLAWNASAVAHIHFRLIINV